MGLSGTNTSVCMDLHVCFRERTQKTLIIFSRLGHMTELGYELELIPSSHLNRLVIEMKGVEVFRCDIRNLLFNVDASRDPVCTRAVNAILSAEPQIYNEENIPLFSSINEGMRSYQKSKTMYTEKTTNLLSSSIKLIYEIGGSYVHNISEIKQQHI